MNEEHSIKLFAIQAEIEEIKVRLINSYGPQENDTLSKRMLFYAYESFYKLNQADTDYCRQRGYFARLL